MAQTLADRRDIDFILHEQLKVEQFAKHELFPEFNRKAVDLIISEARNLAVKEILPTQFDGDRIGVHFENGKVTVPESFHKAWKALRDGEWLARLAGTGKRVLGDRFQLRSWNGVLPNGSFVAVNLDAFKGVVRTQLAFFADLGGLLCG